jgi:Predicted metal-dependent enzyme
LSEQFYYGGQAVIEGVMMRGRQALGIAVRRPDGTVTVREERLRPWSARWPFLKWPVVRGATALVEAMVIGVKALNFSASEQMAEEEGEELGFKELAVTFAVALLLTVGLFVVLPALIIRFIQDYVAHNVLLNFIEGAIKITFFALYIVAIARLDDIKRVFQYHGAEHKAINCYEAGLPLTVDNVRRQSIVHTRCGTNFILIVLLLSVFVFSFFGRPPFLLRVLYHLAVLPLVAGLSYEVIRHAARDDAFFLIKWLATPGLWMQKLTTRAPDDSQIEVAIRALQCVLARDGVLTEADAAGPAQQAAPAEEPATEAARAGTGAGAAHAG